MRDGELGEDHGQQGVTEQLPADKVMAREQPLHVHCQGMAQDGSEGTTSSNLCKTQETGGIRIT